MSAPKTPHGKGKVMVKIGSPAGNVKLGRRFTEEEKARFAAGESIESIIATAPRLPTREEMYAALFG